MARKSRKDLYKQEQEKVAEEIANAENFEESDFITPVYMPTFANMEERELRVVPAKEALQWYLENDEGYFEEDVFPYKKVGKHFKVGRSGSIMPCLNFHLNEPCPVCEENEELKSTGDEDNAEQAKEMRLQRKYAWIFKWVDAPDEFVDVPLVWEVGLKQHNQFLGLLSNTRAPEFDHPFEGASIFVKRIGKKGSAQTYYETDYEKDGACPMFVDADGEFDYETAEAFMEKLPDIVTFGNPFLNYDETKKVVFGSSITDVLKARNNSSESANKEPENDEPSREGRSARTSRRRR